MGGGGGECFVRFQITPTKHVNSKITISCTNSGPPASGSSHIPPFHYQFTRNTEVKFVPALFSVLCEPLNGHKNFAHLRNAVP